MFSFFSSFFLFFFVQICFAFATLLLCLSFFFFFLFYRRDFFFLFFFSSLGIIQGIGSSEISQIGILERGFRDFFLLSMGYPLLPSLGKESETRGCLKGCGIRLTSGLKGI